LPLDINIHSVILDSHLWPCGGLVKEHFMSLRKAPNRTPAFLAAHRRNAQKCTGPKTLAGKARSSLNALKHGTYARRLPEKLRAAGYADRAALHVAVHQEICQTFQPEGPRDWARAARLANEVFATAWRARIFGTKLECPLFSGRVGPRSQSLFPIRIDDPWRGVGLVFWVQRKGYWTMPRLMRRMFAGASEQERDSGLGIRGSGLAEASGCSQNPNPEPQSPIAIAGLSAHRGEEPPLRLSLENRLRHRAFRMRRPNAWEREKYGLDSSRSERDGNDMSRTGGNDNITGRGKEVAKRPLSELEKARAMIRAAKLMPHECY